ncbi:hypothetical protein QFZ54_002872 [Sphingomonas faeni]|nr:hypothetical protein [Sphingomonas faeni]
MTSLIALRQYGGDSRAQTLWSISDRLRFLTHLMSVPRMCGIPLAIASVPRRVLSDTFPDLVERARWHHLRAFGDCMAKADAHIRQNGHPQEVATIVAEHSEKPERQAMRAAMDVYREGFRLKSEYHTPGIADRKRGYSTGNLEFRISRIRDTIHFVLKGKEPLVDVADACAFGFRAWLRGDKFGSQYLSAIGLPETQMAAELWRHSGGCNCYSPPR